MNKKIALLLFVLIPTTRAATVSLIPVADTFVNAADPNNNNGIAGKMAISGAGRTLGEFQSLMRFDLSSVKTSFDNFFGVGVWTVSSVTLKLSAVTPDPTQFNSLAAGPFVLRWMADDSWDEGTSQPNHQVPGGVTWNTLPGFLVAGEELLGTFNYNGATNTSFTYSLELSPGLLGDIGSGGLVSFHCLPDDPLMGLVFNTRTASNVSTRPELTITASAPPDFDGDGDVDQDDFGILQRSPGLIDLATFTACRSGPGVPWNPNCLP